jgi:poly-gamma-glutamate capsule biosynthesis protein CapA/YwtB (metallophosphatase superfamily)
VENNVRFMTSFIELACVDVLEEIRNNPVVWRDVNNHDYDFCLQWLIGTRFVNVNLRYDITPQKNVTKGKVKGSGRLFLVSS